MDPAFKTGDSVRIRPDRHDGHHRAPLYLKGREGVVEHVLGEDRNPETLAYGKDGTPRIRVYTVRFELNGLWRPYSGGGRDILVADFFEHWLERSESTRERNHE